MTTPNEGAAGAVAEEENEDQQQPAAGEAAAEGEEEGEAAAEEGDDEGDEEEGDDEDEGQPRANGKRKPGAERRIDQLHGIIYDLRAENQRIARQMEQLLQQTKPAPPPLPPRPKHADFDTDEEYEDAVYEWRKLKDERAAAEKNPQQPQQPQGRKGADGQPPAAPANVGAYQDQATKARTKYADFDQTVNNPQLRVSDDMVNVVLKTKEYGAELAYWLGKHPNESARIALLPADEVAVELGKIVGRIEAGASKAPAVKKPPQPPVSAKPSNAPAPMTPVGGKAPAVRDPSKMSMEEYAKYMNSKERKKRAR